MGDDPRRRRGIARGGLGKIVDAVRDRTGQDAESLGFASLVVSNVNLLPRLKKLPMRYRLANKAFLR